MLCMKRLVACNCTQSVTEVCRLLWATNGCATCAVSFSFVAWTHEVSSVTLLCFDMLVLRVRAFHCELNLIEPNLCSEAGVPFKLLQ